MNFFNWRETKWGAYTFAVCSGVVLYVLLEHISVIGTIFTGIFSFIKPVIYGIVLAYIMDPLARFYEHYVFTKAKREASRRIFAVTLTSITVLAAIGLILCNLIPQLISSIHDFTHNITRYANGLQSVFGNVNFKFGEIHVDFSNITDTINSTIEAITNHISQNIGSLLDLAVNIGNLGTIALISFIIAIYCLMDKKRLLDAFYQLFRTFASKRVYTNGMRIYNKTNAILSKYIICTLLDALFVGIANTVFMILAGMPYIVLVSTVVGITNMAPTFGPIAGCIIGAFILLLSNPWYAVAFVIFTLILQIIDGYIVKPKFYGNALSVPSIWILISIVVFGRMFGVIGIILAIPFAALIAYLLGDLLNFIESRKKEEK